MKHHRPYASCISLAEVVLSSKILGNRVGILTSVLIAMDYFFRFQKSTFNLENNKCICQGNFFVYHVTGSTYSGIIFRASLKDIYNTLKGIGKKQFILELILLNL